MRRIMIVLAGALAIAGCGESGEAPAANEAASNQTANAAGTSAQPAKPRPTYCFFKDAETKEWSAARGAGGNIVVKGRAYRSDPRYKAEIGHIEVSGDTAAVFPTISQNSGYASPDNWWDVSAMIPGSGGVRTVEVRCGRKVLAQLGVGP